MSTLRYAKLKLIRLKEAPSKLEPLPVSPQTPSLELSVLSSPHIESPLVLDKEVRLPIQVNMEVNYDYARTQLDISTEHECQYQGNLILFQNKTTNTIEYIDCRLHAPGIAFYFLVHSRPFSKVLFKARRLGREIQGRFPAALIQHSLQDQQDYPGLIHTLEGILDLIVDTFDM